VEDPHLHFAIEVAAVDVGLVDRQGESTVYASDGPGDG
jgi:hypothetical protein